MALHWGFLVAQALNLEWFRLLPLVEELRKLLRNSKHLLHLRRGLQISSNNLLCLFNSVDRSKQPTRRRNLLTCR